MFAPSTRRGFLASAIAASAAPRASAAEYRPALPQRAIPRWRGFNLLDFFQALPRDGRRPSVSPEELRWIRDWGFNFVRIPMDYWLWTAGDWRTTRRLRPEDTLRIHEAALEPVDQLVELGSRYGLHVSLNLHRAPGYCINNAEREPFVLWSDARAEEAFAHHWEMFARRYRGVSEFDLSFNLLNEAPQPRDGYMTRADYARVMTRAIDRIRAISPRRLILVDGLNTGNTVVDELIPSGVAQSVHAYWPAQISHYRAVWVDKDSSFPLPTWPVLRDDGTVRMGRAHLEERFAPWAELARSGIGVHCGECGAFHRTPHPVFLAWMRDVLEILESQGIGFALWNFRGPFGVLDSGRQDVDYQGWHGAKLDRRLLGLLRRH